MEHLWNQIQEQFHNKHAFVAYTKPNAEELSFVFQNNDTLHLVEDHLASGFVFAPFNHSEKAIYIPFENKRVVSLANLEVTNHKSYSKESVSEIEKTKHCELVQKGIDKIHEGYFEKVVLSRKENCEITTDTVTIFKRLLKKYTNAFVYLWFHPQVGCWLGATPERLVSIRGTIGKTMALAGTQLHEEGLSWGAKEIDEQQIVTDYILEALKPHTLTCSASEAYTAKAAHLAHLKTDIQFTIAKNQTVETIIKTLHPTPAICGLPQQETQEFILANEHYKRTFYTGYLGELNSPLSRAKNRRNTENKAYHLVTTTSDIYVNLRCMSLEGNNASIYIGGGITKDSDAENEFLETVNKSKTMKAVL